MGRVTSIKADRKKMSMQKENEGWILSMVSSKPFVIVILLLAGIVWYGFYATHTHEVIGSDDRDYASIARNIVNGKGIVKNFSYPVDIQFFEKLPVPEFVHPIGYPLILAGFFKLFGIRDSVALLPSYISYFILILLFFSFVKKHVGIRVATIGAMILMFNKEILDFSLIALSEAVYTPILFLFFILMMKAKSLWDIFVAGLVLGLSQLIRENLYPFLLALFIYLYSYSDLPRWKKMLFFVIGVLIPVLPNMVRSFLETGQPFFSYGKFLLMSYTDQYPWDNAFRDVYNPSLFKFLADEPIQFISKYSSNLVNTLEGFMSVSNPYVLAFFFVEMLYWKITPQWKKGKLLFLFLLSAQILFVPLVTFSPRYFIPFIPIVIIFASQSFLRISDDLVSEVKIQWKRRISLLTVGLFIIVFVIPTTYIILFRPDKKQIYDFKTPQFGALIRKEPAEKLTKFVKDELKENQLICTDLPEIFEWEGDRVCFWLPIQEEMIYEMYKKFPVDAILLTTLRTPIGMGQGWRDLLYSTRSLPQYRTVKLYRDRAVSAKLLIRDGKE